MIQPRDAAEAVVMMDELRSVVTKQNLNGAFILGVSFNKSSESF